MFKFYLRRIHFEEKKILLGKLKNLTGNFYVEIFRKKET